LRRLGKRKGAKCPQRSGERLGEFCRIRAARGGGKRCDGIKIRSDLDTSRERGSATAGVDAGAECGGVGGYFGWEMIGKAIKTAQTIKNAAPIIIYQTESG
jgi:hypothetical protein